MPNGRSAGKLLDDPHLAVSRREIIDKVWLERRLDHSPEEIARLILVHGLDGFPHAYGIASIGIIDVADKPSALEALDHRLFGQKDLFVGRLVTLPLPRSYLSPNDAHVHLDLPFAPRYRGRGAARAQAKRPT